MKKIVLFFTILLVTLTSCSNYESLNENISDFNLIQPSDVLNKYDGSPKGMDGFTLDYVLFNLDSEKISESSIENNPFFFKKFINNNHGYCSFSSSFFETENNELIRFIDEQSLFNCYILKKEKDVSVIIFSNTQENGAYIFFNNYYE